MLTQICNISPGDSIITSIGKRKLVEDIVVSEDGSVKVVYAGDAETEYMPSNHVVLKVSIA
jgi:hypothetical protein